MRTTHGRKQATRLKMTLMSVGLAYVAVGWSLCPPELQATAYDEAWRFLKACLPW